VEIRIESRADPGTRAVAESDRRGSEPPSLRVRQPLTAFPELDCVRHLLPVGTIAEAERRAREIGVGADRALIAAGAISEDDYVTALARHLGVAFEPLESVARSDCPVSDAQLLEAPCDGMLPVTANGVLFFVLALRRQQTARRLCMTANRGPLPPQMRLTTRARLQRFVDAHGAAAIGRKAADELKERHPLQSAAHASRGMRNAGILLAGAALLAVLAAPQATWHAGAAAFALLFISWAVLRLCAALVERPDSDPPPRLHDLPEYSLVVALYREAAVVGRLVASLDALIYPREKLDIKLVVEEDDTATREAIAALALDARYQVILAPAVGPRTKPKALNAALPFVRGDYVVIYDAEDRPERDQLLRALARFELAGERLGCIQARLTIDNTADNWLTGLFTAEYCGLFDVFLPALSAWRLPFPLGGSSNHFRTDALRHVGGWDPYNVTEDADLGMRLARRGYASETIASTTYEEAPGELRPWLRQRSRWFKGWIQTWLVHMRAPRALLRELGWRGFLVFQLVVGGTVLAALIHPVFALAVAFRLFAGSEPGAEVDALEIAQATLSSATFIAGYFSSAALALIGFGRRKLLAHAPVLLLIPILWLLLSLAAWRGLIQLLRDPYRWEKTEHGRARSSRQEAAPSAPVRNNAAALSPILPAGGAG